MVRYLKTPEHVNLPNPDEKQLKQLTEHIRHLEEKLEHIEQRLKDKDQAFTHLSKEKDSIERMLHAFKEHTTAPHVQRHTAPSDRLSPRQIISMAVICVVLGILLWVWGVFHQPYMSSVNVIINNPRSTVSDQLKIFQSRSFHAQFLAQVRSWPFGLKDNAGFMQALTYINRRLYEATIVPETQGLMIKTWGSSTENVKKSMDVAVSLFRTAYAASYKEQLQSQGQAIDAQIKTTKDSLSELFNTMTAIDMANRQWMVSKSIEATLDAIVTAQAPSLDQEMATLKAQTSTLEQSMKNTFGPNEAALIQILKMRLTGLEFKKLLIPPSSIASYDEGIKDTKGRIAFSINNYLQSSGMTELDKSVLIKWIFLAARYEAVRILVNRSYTSAQALSEPVKAFNQVKDDMDALLVKLDEFYQLKAKNNDLLQYDINQDIGIDQPVVYKR